jgi:YD repeat-containing protein
VDARLEYNLRGEMTRAVELAAGTSTMVYDSDTGWLTSIRYGDGRGFDFTHDRLGRRTSRTDTSGIRTEYTYSPRGGLHEVIEVVGTTRTVLVTYGYDDLGRVTSQVNANGTRTLTSYNTSNLVTRVLNETTTGVLISIFDYAFDEAGHLVTRTSTTGSSVTTEPVIPSTRLAVGRPSIAMDPRPPTPAVPVTNTPRSARFRLRTATAS